MLTLQIENMTCGHCVKAITNAILEADQNAQVDVILDQKQVNVESKLEANQIISLLEDEGYSTRILG